MISFLLFSAAAAAEAGDRGRLLASGPLRSFRLFIAKIPLNMKKGGALDQIKQLRNKKRKKSHLSLQVE